VILDLSYNVNMQSLKEMWKGDKQKQVVLFSSTAIALYGEQ